MIYEAINKTVFALTPVSANRILDIGCGTGSLGATLRQSRPCHVTGITYSNDEARIAAMCLDQVIQADLNTLDLSSLGEFDCVIMSHILEHLHSPESFLQRIKCTLPQGSVILVALPNVLHWRQRKEFLLGRWRYQDGGIMDRTHFRFFDVASSEELLARAGYRILEKRYDGNFPLSKPLRNVIGPLGRRLDVSACRRMPGFFAHQFVYLATIHNQMSIELAVDRM